MMRNTRASVVRVAASVAALGATLAFIAPAAASDEFPSELKSQLGLACEPACTICHNDLNGGFGTARKPFGQAMLANGLTAASPETIAPALAALGQDRTTCLFSPSQAPKQGFCDSDGDGTADREQLADGRDPNVTDADLCGSEPRYGCGARVARSDVGVDWLALALAGLTAAAIARSVRRSKRR